MKDYSKIRVAIDGPSGAGKSTIAKKVAQKCGLIYVDTGALYRTVGLYVAENNVDPNDEAAVTACLPYINITLSFENGSQVVKLNGRDVGDKIRTPSASMFASAVSKLPPTRSFLLELQRNIASKGGVIMDGRDIGTVIIPDAELKIFMTASPEARARRRCLELEQKGMTQPYDDVLRDIIERDRADRERESSPCIPADDAILFVNDKFGIEESADIIIGYMEKL